MGINKQIAVLEALLVPSRSSSYLSLVYLCVETPQCKPIDIPLISVVQRVLDHVYAEELPAANRARVDLVVVQLGVSLIHQINERLQRKEQMAAIEKEYLKCLVRSYHDAFPQYKERAELREIFEDFA